MTMETDRREKVSFEKIYLEMTPGDFNRPSSASTLDDPKILKLESPTYEQYREWHDRVGAPYGWHERPRINDRQSIQNLLDNPKVEMFLLMDGPTEIGYALIEEDAPNQVEISDFGFPPESVANGYGSVYFPMILERVFEAGIERVWLSTRSTNDPKVVNFYQKFGLKVYKREKVAEFKAKQL